MTRMLRSSLPDGYFHVFARGVEGTDIYRDDEDRRSFLALLNRTRLRHGWDLHALCLMTTHYHAVLEATRGHLSAGMHWLNGTYAQLFNKRYERRGHLFGARYGARAIESDEYLVQACEYVLLNPVRAGICERARDWPWNATAHDFPDD